MLRCHEATGCLSLTCRRGAAGVTIAGVGPATPSSALHVRPGGRAGGCGPHAQVTVSPAGAHPAGRRPAPCAEWMDRVCGRRECSQQWGRVGVWCLTSDPAGWSVPQAVALLVRGQPSCSACRPWSGGRARSGNLGVQPRGHQASSSRS